MKKTVLFIPVSDNFIQRQGKVNWVPTICLSKDNKWYASYWEDEDAIEWCKVFFVGCETKKEMVEILKKNGFDEVLKDETLNLPPTDEMLNAVRERNWQYMSIDLDDVIYLNTCPD